MCGNIIEGRFDPAKPFFTSKGSFVSNCTTELLASTTDEDRLSHTRNRCNGEGYESVALIPLRVGTKVYGLLQLDTKRKDAYPETIIAELEYLADNLATAIAGRYALEELLEKEQMYRSLFENMINGFAYCQMLYEDGEPVDWVYIATNRAFEKQTGLGNVAGKRVSEVIRGIREMDPDLFNLYARVADTGHPERFEIFVNALRMWFEVSVYSPSRGYFVAVFDVITERKENEKKLKRDLEEKELLLREIHHRVKNNLNVVSSLLDIQSMDIKSKEDAIEAFAKSRDRIFAMALVHDELYAKIEGLSNVDMQSYLKKMTADLQQIYGRGANIVLSADGIGLDVEYAGPCGLIVNELVTNALKHAFKDIGGGTISITMSSIDDGGIELTVSDDGIGFSPDGGKGNVGLSLVRLLVEQLHGRLETVENNGTTFRVQFKAGNIRPTESMNSYFIDR